MADRPLAHPKAVVALALVLVACSTRPSCPPPAPPTAAERCEVGRAVARCIDVDAETSARLAMVSDPAAQALLAGMRESAFRSCLMAAGVGVNRP